MVTKTIISFDILNVKKTLIINRRSALDQSTLKSTLLKSLLMLNQKSRILAQEFRECMSPQSSFVGQEIGIEKWNCVWREHTLTKKRVQQLKKERRTSMDFCIPIITFCTLSNCVGSEKVYVQPNLHLAEHRKKSFQFLASLWKCSRQHGGRVRASQNFGQFWLIFANFGSVWPKSLHFSALISSKIQNWV